MNRGRTIFPNAMALTEALCLATWELTKKRTTPVRSRGQVCAEQDIMYPGRLPRNWPQTGTEDAVRHRTGIDIIPSADYKKSII